MIKMKNFIDMDKEESYLNAMAKQGYILKKFSSFGFYTFEKSSPKELNYKVDYRVFKNIKEFEQYKALFEECGWIHVCGTRRSGGQYFLPSNNNTNTPDIFSDMESKAARYKRFFNQCLLFFVIFFLDAFVIIATNGFKLNKLTYLTPGLWERKGFSFWFGFLFETPFVILRTFPPVIIFIVAMIYGYYSYKAWALYKKSFKAAEIN